MRGAGKLASGVRSAPFGASAVPAPLPEGISLDPHTTLHVRVVFTPHSRGTFSARYLIRGDDGRGAQTISLSGRGV